MTTTTIKLDEILPGDEVTLRDHLANLATGVVNGSTEKRWITVFSQDVTFARCTSTGRWTAVKGIRVWSHLPAIFHDDEPTGGAN